MAWGRIFKRGKNWYTDIITPQGRRKRKKIGRSKEAAQKILDKKLSEYTLEEHGIVEDERITLKEFAKEYLLNKKIQTKASTYIRDEVSVNVHLVPFFGDDFLFNISPHKIFSYQANRVKEGACNYTINREVSCLKHLLNTAVTWRRIRNNPIKSVPKLKEPPGRLRYLTLEEIKTLLASCPDPPHPLRVIVIVALTTGMRKGEILGLKWSYVKMENDLVILPITKNNTVRVLPMNRVLKGALGDYGRLLKGDLDEGCRAESEYVFCDRQGRPFGDVKRSFRAACAKAKIGDFRFHDLRHTYASHLAMRGVHMRALQDLLGHKDIKMTQRYSHLSPEQLQEAVKLLEDAIPSGIGPILTPKPKKGKREGA